MSLGRGTKNIDGKLVLMMQYLVALVLAVLTIGCVGAAFAARGQLLSVTLFSLVAIVTGWATFRVTLRLLEGSSLTVFVAFAFSLAAHIVARF